MEYQVVARFKGSDSQPRFTRTATINELLAEITKAIPVDKIYFVVPHPDGKGFSLREAGLVVLDVLQQDEIHTPQQLIPPAQNGLYSAQEAQGSIIMNKPTPDPTPTPESYKFEPINAVPETNKKKGQKTKKQVLQNDTLGRGQGKTRVTGVIPATPEQAEAASMFGKVQ